MVNLGDAWELQQQYINEYRMLTYSDLAEKPNKTVIELPKKLHPLTMCIYCEKKKSGSIVVSVEVKDEGEFTSSIVSPGKKIRHSSSSVDGFEMLLDGTVIPMHEETYDD